MQPTRQTLSEDDLPLDYNSTQLLSQDKHRQAAFAATLLLGRPNGRASLPRWTLTHPMTPVVLVFPAGALALGMSATTLAWFALALLAGHSLSGSI